MGTKTSSSQALKNENRNKIYNAIRRNQCISGPSLIYELKLSRPTVTQNLHDLTEEGLIFENGSFGNTGGRRAKGYSIVSDYKMAIGLDVTRNHITTVMTDLDGEIVYEKKIRHPYAMTTEYRKKLGALVREAVESVNLTEEQILGVGIVLPALVTEDYKRIFYGKILDCEGMTAEEIGEYIPFPCRLYNDASAAGYAEISQQEDLKDAFYISLSNNIGGCVLIGHEVYRGDNQKSGEVGHITIHPGGKECYCGGRGCFETYCNAAVLSDLCEGELPEFFSRLDAGETRFEQVWDEYLSDLSLAVHNLRMLFDCRIILGGYVGGWMGTHMDRLRKLVRERNPFESDTDYLQPCTASHETLALGGALPFVHELWAGV